MGILIGAAPTCCQRRQKRRGGGALDGTRIQKALALKVWNRGSLLCPKHHLFRFLKLFLQKEIVPVSGGGEDQMQCEAFSTVLDA